MDPGRLLDLVERLGRLADRPWRLALAAAFLALWGASLGWQCHLLTKYGDARLWYEQRGPGVLTTPAP